MAQHGGLMVPSMIKFDEQQELFSWAADNFISLACQTLVHKSYFDVALSGGTTAQGLFKALSHKAQALSFMHQVRFFVSDERMVDLSSLESNAGNLWRGLLLPLGLKRENFFPPYDASDHSLEHCAAAYESLLKNLLDLSSEQVPIFDLLYLGIGQDGHTASLFPGSPLVNNIEFNELLVAASEEQARTRRITFMPKLINAARNICVMAVGEAKAQVISDIMLGPLMPQKLPAQFVLRSAHPHLSVLRA